MSQVCVVGHITAETISVGDRRSGIAPGGTGFYSTFAYQKLGVETVLITKMRPQDQVSLLSQLDDAGATIHCFESQETLQFENQYPLYNLDSRRQTIVNLSDPITMDALNDITADVYHLGPLVSGDIDTSLFVNLSTCGMVVLDVQGLLRPRKSGQVIPEMSPIIYDLVKYSHVLKTDLEEARLLTGRNTTQEVLAELKGWGPREVLVTNGSNGSSISSPEGMLEIPAYGADPIVDPTGCCDTYLSGYIAARLKGLSPYQSAHIGAAAASHKLQYQGPLQTTFETLENKVNLQ